MHQLLIVDDQPDLVDDLAEMLPWRDIGISNVFKAYSAHEALEIVQSNPIDVVITDIRMPGMSGLDLIKQIRTSWRNIKCILLSGYDDFKYAKQGLKHKANDYLLKPVEDEELLQAVQTALKQIDEQWLEITSVQNVQRTLRENIPILQNHLLLNLLEGNARGNQQLAEKLETLEVPIKINFPVILVLLRIEEQLELKFRNETDLLDYAVFNIAEEIFSDHFALWHCKDSHGYSVIVVQPKEVTLKGASLREDTPHDGTSIDYDDILMDRIERKAFQLQHYVRTYLKGTISLLVNRPGIFPDDLKELYQQALFSFRQYIGSERELLVVERHEVQRGEANSLASLYEPPTLTHLLEVGQWEALQAKLEDIFNELEHAWGDSHEHILETYYTIASSLINSIHKSKRWIANILEDDFDTLASGTSFNTIEQLRTWTYRVIAKFQNAMREEMQDSRSSIVKQVQKYVSDNLHNATLQTIASHVYLNPSYLSKIYKLETGEGISEYLYRLKMDQAAHLLSSTHVKIYEIANHLGYMKASYFIKLFKDRYGMTPQEYRDSLLR